MSDSTRVNLYFPSHVVLCKRSHERRNTLKCIYKNIRGIKIGRSNLENLAHDN